MKRKSRQENEEREGVTMKRVQRRVKRKSAEESAEEGDQAA